MTIEHWLRESVAQPPPSRFRRFLAKRIIGILFFIIFMLVLARPAYQFILAWMHTSAAARALFLERLLAITPVLIGVLAFIYFVLPGKWTGKTGWQLHQLNKKDRALAEILDEIRRRIGTSPVFSPEAFSTAAAKLTTFKPLTLDTLKAQAHEPWLHILILSGAIEVMRGKVIKIVSLASIKEDREAGFEEE